MNYLPLKPKDPTQDGFTIIELLIASTLFAIILVIITVGIIDITESYTKGVTENATQDVARNIINDISQAIEFTSGQITSPAGSSGLIEVASNPAASLAGPQTPGSVYGFCVGDREYIYQIGYEVIAPSQVLTSPSTTHESYGGFVVNPSSANCPNPTPAPGGSLPQDNNFWSNPSPPAGFNEYLNPNMRLSYLVVCQGTLSATTGLCTYNAGSTIYTIGVQVSYGNNQLFISDMPPADTASDGSTLCHGASGSEFCATSKLITVVEKRVI
jgi:prepilin-type N-terminal cleavage/methylation domain-containing protein